jgi:hypothetical protein
MCGDYRSARRYLAAKPVIVVEPFEGIGPSGRTCWHHVRHVIQSLGGTFAYGWALGTPGPLVPSNRLAAPLYARWVNHVLWLDPNGVLWEVTPVRDELDCKLRWEPTHFIRDDEAQFEIAADEICCPRPAVYVAVRPDGERTADCLCEAERASPETQGHWINAALDSIQQAGLVPVSWRVKRVGDKLRDVLVVASE